MSFMRLVVSAVLVLIGWTAIIWTVAANYEPIPDETLQDQFRSGLLEVYGDYELFCSDVDGFYGGIENYISGDGTSPFEYQDGLLLSYIYETECK